MDINMFTKALEEEHNRAETDDLELDLGGKNLELDDDDLDYKALAEQEAQADKEAESTLVDDNRRSTTQRTSPSLISLPVPPDGGWGWVVCASSFMVMIILDGLLFRLGPSMLRATLSLVVQIM